MKKISIYKKLVLSYILFSLLMIIMMAISLIGIAWLQTEGNLDSAYPYDIINERVCREYLPGIKGLNGWVEKLDDNYRVIEVYGEKRTDNDIYTPAELYQLISGDKDSPTEYIGFLNQSEDHSGYYLVHYHRSDIQIETTIMYSAENSNPLWGRLTMVIFLILFIGTCLLMATYLSRRIKRPLRNLSGAMNQFKTGEEAIVLDFKAEAEFAEIRDTFNMMTQSLAETRWEKEKAEDRKNKMMLELSHDIRTPISTINSFAVALYEGMVKEEDKQDYYKTIHMKAVRVSNLADDIFTMLKMRSGDYQLQKNREDICEFLRRQCAEYYQDAQEKGLEMIIDIPEKEIYYEADYDLLTRVIENLLTNAIKYNCTGKKLEVRMEKKEGRIMISVVDDGMAIAEEIRDRLFDDFTRGDSARKSDGGTGLGLSIAGAIVEKHGGNIRYECCNNENHFIIVLD